MERMAGLAAPALKYDLDRMRELARRLGLPAGGAPVVHVAGTKGKGSVAAMVSNALRAQGLRTGLYTSPHLHTFRERIRIDGAPLAEDAFAAAAAAVWPAVEEMASGPSGSPTTFEALTAMAFDAFRTHDVDAAVLEVGLGGRLDATNVAESSVAVITSISYDHTAILGSTLAEIAGEKVGIIERPQPVVSAPQASEAMDVIERRCEAMGAALTIVGADVSYVRLDHDLTGQTVQIDTARGRYRVRLPLLGDHQAENAAVAVAALEQSPFPITQEAIEAGLRSVRWDGRFQVLSRSPYLVVDGAHNAYSMARLAETVREYLPDARVHLVCGVSSDKQTSPIAVEAAGMADSVWTVSSRHPRALPAADLAGVFERLGARVESAGAVGEAVQQALDRAGPGDLVLVTGSLFVVAEALEWALGVPGEHYPEFDPQAAALSGRGA